ncbi:phosphodiester glycosidase family protein [Sporolactobacillus nakayamae]|uniref:LPXTG-motif cell wall anchor domain-containing protein n=1 Tax=Sporolactobacillus nakayamae TaxID=269670 RepID=A0A1I2UFZ8_9BACL|nr:phosphodiester glycosidase family protein [Sporolactobacillus nakayamae]SFG75289.1 LPXTG-motif cell wall anchor domain-containing protein [Sporolactobacillus nakayamae]
MKTCSKSIVSIILATCLLFVQFSSSIPAHALDQTDVSSSVMKQIISETGTQLASGIEEKHITYKNAAGDRTELFAVNVNLKDKNTALYPGTPNDGQDYGMQSVRDEANAAIKNGKNVVSGVNANFFNMATGEPEGNVVKNGIEIHQASRSDETFFGVLKDGTPVIGDQTKYNQIKANLKQALGAKNILVKDGKIGNTSAIGADIEPRTAVGIKSDNTVFFVVIDGRQAPYSNGISMPDLAQLMRDMGAVQAVNLDGGGSTTYISRTPGEDELSLKNRPSDGNERLVANSWLITSNAPADHAFASAAVSPADKTYSPNSKITFTAKGKDAAGYSAPLPTSGLNWSLSDPAFGQIDTNTGVFQSNGKQGTVTVNLSYNGKTVGSTHVEIAVPDTFWTTNSNQTLQPGASSNLGLTATYQGRYVQFSREDLDWQISDGLGSVDNSNVFHATSGKTQGNVEVKFKNTNLSVNIQLQIGQDPVVVEDAEELTDDAAVTSNWSSSAGKRGESVSVSSSGYPNSPVRFGNHAAKVNFDFTTGQKASTLLVYAGPTHGSYAPGTPTSVGMWIYGTPEAQGLQLWTGLSDADGKNFGIYMPPVDGQSGQMGSIDWLGWRYVSFPIPSGYKAPYKLRTDGHAVGILCLKSGLPNGDPMTKGSLYFDNFRFVYDGNTSDDLKSPVIDSISVDGKTYTNAQVNVTTAIHEDTSDAHATGINWDRNRIWVDGTEYTDAKGHYSYDKDGTFTLSGYQWADGVHHVHVSIQDNFGNETVKDAYFTVNTGNGTKLSLNPKGKDASLGGTYSLALSADDLSNVKEVTATINLGKGFPVKGVSFAESAAGSTYTYDPTTGDLNLTIQNDGASKQAGDLATIMVSVPATAEEGTKIPYSVTEGKVTFAHAQGTTFNASFSTTPSEVSIAAAYQIQVERMVVGSDGIVQVQTQDGQPVSGAEVSMTLADGKTQSLGKTDTQGKLASPLPTASAQKFKLIAQKGNDYSFAVSDQSYNAQKTAEPSNILVGATQNPKTEKSVTWMTNPLQSEDRSIMQVATRADYTDQGDQAFQNFTGTKKLVTYSLDSSAIELNSAKAIGLKPGTLYVFRVGDGKNWSDIREFKTLTDSDQMTFNVFGDTQVTEPSGLEDFDKILTRIENASVQSDFAIHVGDFTDDQTIFGEADMTAEMFNKHPAFDSLDMIHVLGNHEYQGDNGVKSASMLAMPNSNGTESNKTGTYSVDYGNMHIAVIGWTDNVDTMKKEMDWLRSDMKATNQTWKIIATHQPAYNKNPADAQATMFHDMLVPVCDELGIDLVFNGHDHSYGRTYPLVANTKASVGTVYIATGHTGDKTYDIEPNDPSVFEVIQKDKNEVVYLTAHVNGNKMELIAEHPDGSVVDDVTLTAHPADKTQLEAAVKSAKALNLNDFSIIGQNDFASAMSHAQKVLDNADAIPQDVISALDDLSKAQDALKKSANKTALEAAIAKANKLDLSKYKDVGKDAFKTKLQDAIATYDNNALSVDDQKQVQTTIDALNQAIADLQLIDESKDDGTSDPSNENDISKAEQAVQSAEQSRAQKDVDAAVKLVNALPNSSDKSALTTRLKAIHVNSNNSQENKNTSETNKPDSNAGKDSQTNGNNNENTGTSNGQSDQAGEKAAGSSDRSNASTDSSSTAEKHSNAKNIQKQDKGAKASSLLPKTGDVFNVWTVSFGVILILIATGIVMRKKEN